MLCRFRQDFVAVMGNIKGMFHQVPLPHTTLVAQKKNWKTVHSFVLHPPKAALTSPQRRSQVTTDIYTEKKQLTSSITISMDNSLKSLVCCNIKGCCCSCCYVINNERSTLLVSASSSFCFVKPRICAQCIFSSKR